MLKLMKHFTIMSKDVFKVYSFIKILENNLNDKLYSKVRI